MKHYVLGFVFNRNRDKVLLIRKERPSWQAGKWNGIGGKVENKDINPLEAMQRESIEKTAMEYNWEHCITFVCSGGTVFVYRAFDDCSCGYRSIRYKQMEDEKLDMWWIDSLPDKMMDNLKWLISICLSDIQLPINICLKDVE